MSIKILFQVSSISISNIIQGWIEDKEKGRESHLVEQLSTATLSHIFILVLALDDLRSSIFIHIRHLFMPCQTANIWNYVWSKVFFHKAHGITYWSKRYIKHLAWKFRNKSYSFIVPCHKSPVIQSPVLSVLKWKKVTFAPIFYLLTVLLWNKRSTKMDCPSAVDGLKVVGSWVKLKFSLLSNL